MTLRGSLSTMSIADVFDWLERRQPTGELTLDRANQTRRFQLAGDAIISASSTDPAEYLGQILVNNGTLREEQLRDAYASQANDGIMLGKILLLSGLVTEAQIAEALDLKIREGLFDALSWEVGTFQFDLAAGTPRPLEVEVALPFAPLRQAGVERIEKWRTVRAEIPGDDSRFFVPDKAWLDKAKPGSPSALILQHVVRGLSVREISLALHSMPFPIYQRLFDLLARGIVKLDRRTTPRAEAKTSSLPPPELIDAARGRARGGDRVGALELAKQALAEAPTSEPIRKAYQELERGLFAELSRTLLARFCVPRLLKTREELQRLPMSAEERYLVDRIDGHWDLLSLMRVSPLREVEALITFSKLKDKGLISLD